MTTATKMCCHLKPGDVLETAEVVTRVLWTPGLLLALIITDTHAHTWVYDDLLAVMTGTGK